MFTSLLLYIPVDIQAHITATQLLILDGYVMTNSVPGIVMLTFDFIMMFSAVFGSCRDARLTRVFELMIVNADIYNC